MSRRLRQAVAYPLLLLAMLFAWLLFVTMNVLPQVIAVLNEPYDGSYATDYLGFSLPIFAAWVPWILAGLLAAGMIVLVTVWLFRGTAGLSRLLTLIPLIGPCWRDRGLADFTGLLGEFVDARFTLPEALQLTARGIRDPALRRASTQAVSLVERGSALAPALHFQGNFPDTLTQWSAWGQERGPLPAAMRAAAETFSDRFDLRLQFLRTVFPAIVFSLIAASAVFVAAGVFRLMSSFIVSLSGDYLNAPESSQQPILLAGIVVGVLVVGLTLLLLGRAIRTRSDATEIVALVARYIGITFIAGALLVGSILVTVVGWLGWLLLMFAWIRGAWRYRQMQRQELWTTLSLAAERHAPLAPMALAFADEQRGSVALAARQLARELAAGADLAEALAWTKGALPPEARLAIRVGTDTGDLFGALRATRGNRGTGRPLMPAAVVWLLIFLPVALGLISFMQIKIMPSFVAIFDDFSTSLPPLTVMMITVVNWTWLPFVALALAFLAILFWLQWRGTLQPRLPGLKRVARWVELAPLLRILSLVTQRGQSLSSTLESMARLHPHAWMRRRLRTTLRDLEMGSTWQASLRQRRMLSDGELAVLAAAERNGNLPWALAELGDSLQRRAEFRLKFFGEFAFPLLVALVGLTVALIVVAYFLPLVNLIISLS